MGDGGHGPSDGARGLRRVMEEVLEGPQVLITIYFPRALFRFYFTHSRTHAYTAYKANFSCWGGGAYLV